MLQKYTENSPQNEAGSVGNLFALRDMTQPLLMGARKEVRKDREVRTVFCSGDVLLFHGRTPRQAPWMRTAHRRHVHITLICWTYRDFHSSRVITLPGSCPSARAFRTLLMILPLRVLGSVSTMVMASGLAIGPSSCPT